MSWSLYKPGQGYYTRLLSAIAAGTLVLCGIFWIWGKMQAISAETRVFWQAGMALTVIFVMGTVLYWVFNRPDVAEFMIATEAEMKKVNWPSQREIVGSTIVVIGGTIIFACFLLGADVVFSWLFQELGVLQTTS
ncbi:preprotein translocase subunit SecE [Mucisphaera calidilacus]|uniref:Protein translocase subunit SecE n=1 Tax=Mucisphaera calidilacus TaxID=2527982 RepID=A0A518BTT9_9BACT|nr:preprotein translocase subunit SecE [Mucisphaera calidilacus]QDU70388.1 preprotein translocase subunit SecE [Mucisphaera calidilacus]